MTDNLQEKIKALTQPWQHSEIKWRIGAMTKKKDKAMPLAYIDARTVMERLDAVVGVENWQDRYEFHDKRTMCYLSIRLNDEWICKADGAGDSDIEGEKGAISDAFKRASVKWGMGRELYEMKCRWMPVNEYKQLVGDPWDFVIKPDAKPAVVTPEEKREKADNWVNGYLLKLEPVTDSHELINLQTDNAAGLKAIIDGYPDLHKVIVTATDKVRGE